MSGRKTLDAYKRKVWGRDGGLGEWDGNGNGRLLLCCPNFSVGALFILNFCLQESTVCVLDKYYLIAP